MYQPYPPGGQSAEPLRPPAPAPVRTAVKLMYAGAAVSAVNLIISLAVIGGLKAYHGRFLGHSLTAAQVSDLNTVIIAAVVTGLVVIVLWLWMARANGQGRNWARILSTVLFGLATLELTPYLFGFGEVFGVTVFGLIFPLLTWLVGLAAVWLLWRPASSAVFRPPGITQPGSGAAISSRIRSSRARPPRQW